MDTDRVAEALERIADVLESRTEPFEGFDRATAAQIMAWLQKNNPSKGQVRHMIHYERTHKGRDDVVVALVNWNS